MDRPGYVGDYGLGFARRISRVGRASADGTSRWHAGSVRGGGVFTVSSGGVLARAFKHAGEDGRQGLDKVRVRGCVQSNPKSNWFAGDILGIDQGISVLMAENLRSGFAWQYFMKNREIVHAMNEVQFHPDPDANTQVL